MAFCSNCGAQHSDTERFCGDCGYPTGKTAAPVQTAPQQPTALAPQQSAQTRPQPQQVLTSAPPPVYQPTYQQQPTHQQQPTYQPQAPAKKKSKAPFIIGGGVVVVAAIAAAVIFTNGFGLLNGGGLFGNSSDDFAVPAVSSGINVEMPGGVSDDEKAAYEYIQGVVAAFEYGMEYDEMGLLHPAESFFGTAASSLCALRYAADCLLGEISDDGRPSDWNKIASMGWRSPAAYFFEGLVLEAQGKAGEAADAYAKAAVNPYFDGSDALKGIANISGDSLRRLRDKATRVEDEMFSLYSPTFYPITRHERNYDPVYLSEQGAACLNSDVPDTWGALMYYQAALSVNPFSGYIYAGLAVSYISVGDEVAAEAYLQDGLIIDPESPTLNALIDILKGESSP